MNPDFSEVFAGLKDFQQTTVDHVFQRMYLDDPPARRFLVADEVGLGKTLVARGLIARAVTHLMERNVPRIDVVYICSNADIARQNISRLSLPGFEAFTFSSRLTLLPLEMRDLSKSRLNFISFTPGTSFNLRSSMGWSKERALLYWLLKRRWPHLVGTKKGPLRVMQGTVASLQRFASKVDYLKPQLRRIDKRIVNDFYQAMDRRDADAVATGSPTLREQFSALSQEWAYDRKDRSWDERHGRALFIGELRNLLAHTCIGALEPDLVILDEFQRFRDLLSDDGSEATALAHDMFTYSDEHTDVRVLLMSATPYKMYTLPEESNDDHYADFLRTVEFLREGEIGTFAADLGDLRRHLTRLGSGKLDDLVAAKKRVESQLRQVMTRTERLAVSPERDGMLEHVADGPLPLHTRDLVGYVNLQQAADTLEGGSLLEYWKSTPYFANFWQGYKIGQLFDDADVETRSRIRGLLEKGRELIPWDDYRRYAAVDPGNARLRGLVADLIERDAWKLLWLAPSQPYYGLEEPFAGGARLTKRLVFSAWTAVPKAVSTLLSYEAERRMMSSGPGRLRPNTPEGRERFTEPLRFPKTGTGMSAFAMVYPSPALARYADPLQLARRHFARYGTVPRLDDVLALAEDEILRRLSPHLGATGPEDERWYWAAPLLLDHDLPGHGDWLRRRHAARAWLGDDVRSSEGFELHLNEARRLHRGELELGRPPDDLASVLARLAVAGPGTVALRSLGRITSRRRSEYTDTSLRDAAARIAWGLRSVFNSPEVASLLRGLVKTGPYWQKVLHYCAAGCLQAAMDEYLHVLVEWLGILDPDDPDELARLADNVADVVSLRAADLRAHDPLADEDREQRMRCRFALPFGQYRSEEESQVRRSGYVRAAFNSPFWPFVVATTSIGQEGLDFHLYCHAVIHWNLPANPVDLEQREGRVHRYMGHAVRRNLAERFGLHAFRDDARDPWQAILEAAVRVRDSGHNDLVPYWVCEGTARIQRHVPAFPLSRDLSRMEELQSALAIYRLVIGQPRQEELLRWLQQQEIGEGATRELIEKLRLDLSPVLSPDRSDHPPTPGS